MKEKVKALNIFLEVWAQGNVQNSTAYEKKIQTNLTKSKCHYFEQSCRFSFINIMNIYDHMSTIFSFHRKRKNIFGTFSG